MRVGVAIIVALSGIGLFVAVAIAADTVAVRGRVTDTFSGTALTNARITIVDGSGTSRQLLTDTHGRFVALDVAYGNTIVRADANGHAPESFSCRIPSGGSTHVDFQLPTGFTRIYSMDHTCHADPLTSDTYIIH